MHTIRPSKGRTWGGSAETYSIFDPVAPPTQGIILEVEKLEAGVDVFDEFADLERAGEVAQGYSVRCETGLERWSGC